MLDIIIAFIKSGGAMVSSILFNILTTKIFASFLGTEGIGLYSIIKQARETFLSVAALSSETVFVQGIASRSQEEKKTYSSLVLVLLLFNSLLIVLFLQIFAPQLAQAIFGDHGVSQGEILIRWLAVPIVLDTLLAYLSGMLNGYRAIGRLAIVQVITAGVTGILSYPVALFVQDGNPAAFIFLMTLSSLMGVGASFYFAFKMRWLPTLQSAHKFYTPKKIKVETYSYLSFAFVLIISNFAYGWGLLYLRSTILERFGLDAAGVFDAGWTVSMTYIAIVAGSFATYYLPTLSQAESNADRNITILRFLRITIFIMFPLLLVLIIVKPLVIQILYTPEFIPALHLLKWMLIGDFIKITGWVFGISIKAIADKKAFLLLQFFWIGGFITLSQFLLTRLNSLEGIGIAYVIIYSAYMLLTFQYVRRVFDFRLPGKLFVQWLVGLFCILFFSAILWSTVAVNWQIVLWGGLAAVWFSNWLFPKADRRYALYLIRNKMQRK